MNGIVTIDRAGRLVLPKPLREVLRLAPGDSLEITAEEDRVTLTPVRTYPGLHKKRGLWVFRSGKDSKASIPDLIEESRKARTRQILGE